MLEAKVAGQEIARPEPAPEAPVIDLMDALKQSVAQAQQDKGKAASAKPKKKTSSGRKRAAAR
jgi:non-homologous end joining protein Ku